MAKAKEITIVNTGVCAIYIGTDRIMPDEEMNVPAEALETSAFGYLIARGEISVKDNSAMNKEIKERVLSKRKKDKDEGKTKAQLEDGGEF